MGHQFIVYNRCGGGGTSRPARARQNPAATAVRRSQVVTTRLSIPRRLRPSGLSGDIAFASRRSDLVIQVPANTIQNGCPTRRLILARHYGRRVRDGTTFTASSSDQDRRNIVQCHTRAPGPPSGISSRTDPMIFGARSPSRALEGVAAGALRDEHTAAPETPEQPTAPSIAGSSGRMVRRDRPARCRIRC